MTTKKLATVIGKRGRWYIGYVPEVPGANTQGRTFHEAKENLREALMFVLQAKRELGQPARVYTGTIVVEV